MVRKHKRIRKTEEGFRGELKEVGRVAVTAVDKVSRWEGDQAGQVAPHGKG